MKLIETIALRRSGHHAIMSWYMKNLIDTANWDYTVTVQAGTKTIIWNDGGYNENEIDMVRGLKMKPENIFINYEDKNSDFTFFEKTHKYKGVMRLNKYEDFSFNDSNRILIIRDFYNNLCSRIQQNKKQDFKMNIEKNFINMWKDHAKSILNDEIHYIKYEDWLTCDSCRKKFLQDVFGIKERVKKEQAKGTHSSYDTKSTEYDYLNRFDSSIIHDDVKKLIREDNELHYLIGALGYTYKEI
jgi:hypothetical protein